MRESAHAKSRRYLHEGRLVIEEVRRLRVVATCRGDGQLYQLGWTPAQGWHCTCLARGRCAHLLALGSVVAVDTETGR